MKTNTLLKLVLFCLLLVLTRFLKTGHYSFIFLFWNLFLAWLPYYFIMNYSKVKSRFAQMTLIGMTILFLPNAPYLLTDLFHLSKNLVAPLWFDLVLILSFALLGLILFVITTDELLKAIVPYFRSRIVFACCKLLIILSNGYGIYLGRYLRFNSWDIVSRPDELASGMFRSVFDLNCYKETLAVSFTFAIFLYLLFEIYESFKKKLEQQNGVF